MLYPNASWKIVDCVLHVNLDEVHHCQFKQSSPEEKTAKDLTALIGETKATVACARLKAATMPKVATATAPTKKEKVHKLLTPEQIADLIEKGILSPEMA